MRLLEAHGQVLAGVYREAGEHLLVQVGHAAGRAQEALAFGVFPYRLKYHAHRSLYLFAVQKLLPVVRGAKHEYNISVVSG